MSETRMRITPSATLWICAILGGGAAIGVMAIVEGPRATARTEQLRFTAAATPKPQPRATRIWDAGRPALHATAAPGKPTYLVPAPSGGVAYLDPSEYAFVHLADDGETVTRTPIARESLLSSSLPVTAIATPPDGSRWITSASGRIAEIATRPGAPIRSLPGAYQIAPLGDDLAAMQSSGPYLFALYRSDGTLAGKFGQFLENQQRHSIALDGQIAADPTGRTLLYVSYYGGFFSAFDAGGALRFVRSLVAARPMPPVRVQGEIVRAPRLPADSPEVWDITSDGERIHVLMTLPQADGPPVTVIDTYALSDGRYQRSVVLPLACRELTWSSGAFFGLCGDRVHMWRKPAA